MPTLEIQAALLTRLKDLLHEISWAKAMNMPLSEWAKWHSNVSDEAALLLDDIQLYEKED